MCEIMSVNIERYHCDIWGDFYFDFMYLYISQVFNTSKYYNQEKKKPF